MQWAAVAIAHQQRMDQALLRLSSWLLWLHWLLRLCILLWLRGLRRLHGLLRLCILLRLHRLLRLRILRWLHRLLRLRILLRLNRLLRFCILMGLNRLLRLCNMLWLHGLLRLGRRHRLTRWLGFRHHARRKQRFTRRIIYQIFHWREFKVRQREGVSPCRLLTGITPLLGGGELASQLSFGGTIFVILRFKGLWLGLILITTVPLLLLLSELAGQLLLLLHFIGIVVVVFIILLTSGFTRFLFGHSLGRQLDTIRGQFTAGRNTYAVRTRQLRTNPLFYLRTRCAAGCQAE